MNKFLYILGLIVFTSCSEAILEKNEYVVIDTIESNKNGFNKVLSYDVVVRVEEDSSLHYGKITLNGKLVEINFKKIKNYYK
jgi:hypothetical protein